MKIFYCRISTEEQNEQRQLQTAEEVKADKVYIDKASGKNANRPQLKEMMNYVRDGDIVICSDISRIARNTKDLLNIVEELNRKQATFISIKENIDTSTPQGKFMLTVFGAIAELERESIRQRQAEGIAIAKAQGKYKGGTKKAFDEQKMKEVCRRWRNGDITAVKAQQLMDMKPNTFYRRVKELEL